MKDGWTAPARTDAPPARTKPIQWKVDESDHDGVRIYATPETVGNIRLVAQCERRDEADLIVSLYEKYRQEVAS